ncbi:MAG: hypothetical protein NDJ19_11330 [Ramlibacter sp.]|nr:hypothetical protein [Ramlibacter sp.]
MAPKTESPGLFDPIAYWTDLGLRGLEMTLSSAQSIGEGVERLTRAGASAAASEQVESPAAGAAHPAGSAFELAAQLQRTTFELMERVWQQWMSAFGTLSSLGVRGATEDIAWPSPWMSVMPDSFQPSGRRRNTAGRGKERARLDMDHALANAEPGRRARAGHTRSKSARPRSR